MSVIPEVIIQRTIVNGFRSIRKDPRILDAIFRHMHQDQLQNVKDYILKTPIDFSINYPRENLKTPSFVLLLKSENESQTWLGDLMGDSSSSPYIPDTDLSYDTLGGHGASLSSSSGLPRKVAGPLQVSEQTGESTIEIEDDLGDLIDDLQQNPQGCLKLYVVQGSGAGETYDIMKIRENSLDIIGTFDPYLDSTSVVDIRVPDDPELAVGEPSRVFSADATNLNQRGVNYDVTYQIHVLAGGQDKVIYLYSTLKAILLSQRQFLESQGLLALRISGSDFAPRTEYLPSEVFQRMLLLQFTYPFSFIEEQETFDRIRVNLLPEPGDTVIEGTTITLDV